MPVAPPEWAAAVAAPGVAGGLAVGGGARFGVMSDLIDAVWHGFGEIGGFLLSGL